LLAIRPPTIIDRMAERRFLCDHLDLGLVTLSPDEAHHARDVLRLHPGDTVELFDGRGHTGHGRVASVTRREVAVEIERINPPAARDRCVPLTLAVAFPKAARQNVLIEKCTELGVEAIWPIVTQWSVVRPGPNRLDHWRKVVVAAAKQCGRSFLPELVAPKSIHDIAEKAAEFSMVVVGSTGRDAPSLLDVATSVDGSCRMLVVIGPEGGLTAEEESILVSAGARPFSLGRWTLRVETAAISAVAVLSAWIARAERPPFMSSGPSHPQVDEAGCGSA
jgi:16S rRNA (uracil1498-N3)-methyltransferase